MTDHIEIMITTVDYTVTDSDEQDAEPVLHVFGRDRSNNAQHVKIHGKRPFFYAAEAPIENIFALEDEYDVITGIEPGYESIKGRDLVKIYTEIPANVSDIRDDFTHYEADILFPNRFLLDHGIRSGIRVPTDDSPGPAINCDIDDVVACDMNDPEFRVHHMDIEVDDRNGFPEEGKEEIICLTSWDSYRDEYILWVYTRGDDYPDSMPDSYEPLDGRSPDEIDVRLFEREAVMMESYLDYVDETNPDLLTGWNFEDFDVPYVMDRIRKLSYRNGDLNLDTNRLSRLDTAYYRSGEYGGVTAKGRVVMDLLEAYKATKFTELDSYRLEAVGETELGVGKTDYDGDIGDLWEEDPSTLYEYSVRDVELTVGIDEQQSTFTFWKTASHAAGCFINDATTASDIVDMYVLHKTVGKFVLPSKGADDYEDYDGGSVFDPVEGLERMVSVLDLKSLYPMCMSTLNLSPETLVEDPQSYDGETYKSPPIPARDGERLHFRKEPDGIIREIIDELLNEREMLKRRRDECDPDTVEYSKFNRQQAAIKVIMNSLYGVLGWEQFRLYDKDMGAAVTATGRGVIEFTEQVVEEEGYEVTYGDTDSVMIALADTESKEEAMETSFELVEKINSAYDRYAETLNADEHRFQMEFEKLYRTFFQAGKKKRYAGHIIWKEGSHVDKVDITGFEYVRSSTAEFTRQFQKEVLDMIVRGDESEVRAYVNEEANRVKNGDVPVDEIGIPGGIGQPLSEYDSETAQVRGAKFANLLFDLHLGHGDKPKRVYLESVHSRFYRKIERRRKRELERDELYARFKRQFADSDTDPVICFETGDQIPDEFMIDWDLMLEKAVEGPISRIIEPLGITWDEAVTGTEQKSLGDW